MNSYCFFLYKYNLSKAFLVSAESGSFSAAADKLGYTPAGIGQMVDSVEESLGVSIMNKISIDDLNRRVKYINFEEDLNTELGILVPKTKTCPITWRLIRFINGLFNE